MASESGENYLRLGNPVQTPRRWLYSPNVEWCDCRWVGLLAEGQGRATGGLQGPPRNLRVAGTDASNETARRDLD